MSQALLYALAFSLILTLALETGFFLLTGKRNKKDLLLVILVNIITNPPVVLLYWLSVFYTSWNGAIVKIPLELFAVLAEGYYYKKYGQDFQRPYAFSFAANRFSFWIGVLLQQFI
jgi:hypothetical protein